MIYNNREFSETDFRRYVNMEHPMFKGITEHEVFEKLNEYSRIQIILCMIKECAANITMYSGCPCHSKDNLGGSIMEYTPGFWHQSYIDLHGDIANLVDYMKVTEMGRYQGPLRDIEDRLKNILIGHYNRTNPSKLSPGDTITGGPISNP